MSYRHSETLRSVRPTPPPPFNYNPYRPGRALLWTSIGACTAVFAAWQYAQSGKQVQTSRSWGGFGPAKRVETTQMKVGTILKDNFLLSPRDLAAGKYWTLVTSAFSHANPTHFLVNMFSMHAFSSVVIMSVHSPWHLGALMLGSAVSGSAGWLYNHAKLNTGRNEYALGASGMVMGIGTAAAMLRPKMPMAVLGIIPAPLWLILGGYVAIDTYYVDNPQSRIGHAAHLGGAAFGAVYYTLVLRRYGGIFSSIRG